MKEYILLVADVRGLKEMALAVQLIQHRHVNGYDPAIQDSYGKAPAINGGRRVLLHISKTAGPSDYSAIPAPFKGKLANINIYGNARCYNK